jgi:hypothetical protein
MPDEAQMQGARDRGGRQGQDVDLLAHRLDPLLVADAEALLLVDHQQPEVGEGDVLRQDPMRPDEDVDRSVRQALDDPLLLLLPDEAAEHPDLDREGGQAPLEGDQVLLRKHGGRHQDGDLLAVLDRLERRAQRHLRLAIPDVADDEPVHRPLAEHVGLDLLDAPPLVGRLRIREALLELALPGRIGAEGEPGRGLPRRVDLDQLAGEIADRASHAPLRALPLGAAQPAERRRRTPGVAGDAADLVGWQEDLVGAGEVELEVLAHIVAERALRHPHVTGDAVVDVDDVVARLQLADQVAGDHPLRRRQPPDARRPEELAIGEDQQPARLVHEAR